MNAVTEDGMELMERDAMLDYYRFKTVCDLFMKGKTEEARLELAELQRRYVALCDENTTFKMQVQEYEDILYLARNLVYDNGFYWLITGSIKQGPFCPHCYDRDGLLIRLVGEPGDRGCVVCRSNFVEEAMPPVMQEMAAAGGANGRESVDIFAMMPVCEAGRANKAKVIPFSK